MSNYGFNHQGNANDEPSLSVNEGSEDVSGECIGVRVCRMHMCVVFFG